MPHGGKKKVDGTPHSGCLSSWGTRTADVEEPMQFRWTVEQSQKQKILDFLAGTEYCMKTRCFRLLYEFGVRWLRKR